MLHRIFFLFCAFLLIGFPDWGQDSRQLHPCALSRLQAFSIPFSGRPESYDKRMDDYDVTYTKLDLHADNSSTYIGGSATTIAQVTAVAMQQYVFELIDTLTIDSVVVNGQILDVRSAGFVHEIDLPQALQRGATFTAQVYYHGTPPYTTEMIRAGIRHVFSEEWGIWATYTLSEPYAAREWWPCKQSLTDKIDSSDVWITVPDSLKAGSNGILERITAIPGGFNRFEWRSRFPIDYYLVSLAVSSYIDYSYFIHFEGSSDSTLCQNYIYDRPGILDTYKTAIDSTTLMMAYFSELFGRYPYWAEKYGHCLVPLGGGMEHQTMTTLGSFASGLVAHELGHQWFGDYVTCGTWSDIWLNEGLATYTEYIFIDRFQGHRYAIDKMKAIHEDVLTEPGGSVYCTDVADVGRLFNGRLTYSKGGAVVHSLRHLIQNDSIFFSLLRDYLQHFAHSTVTTDQFRDFVAQYTGKDMDTFFSQWVYGEGYPVYKIAWNQEDGRVFLRLEQSASLPESVTLFSTPLDIRLSGERLDTVIRIYNNQLIQLFAFEDCPPVQRIDIDPEYHVLKRVDSIRRDYSLTSINGFDTTLSLVYPNPSAGNWTVEGLPANCSLRLTDMTGRVVWEGNNGHDNAILIDGRRYATGQYILTVNKSGVINRSIKLVNTR